MACLVEEHRKTYDEDSMRNFIDAYMKQMETSRDPGFNGKDPSSHIYLFPNFRL